jgi:hypothetical protein
MSVARTFLMAFFRGDEEAVERCLSRTSGW